MSASGNGPHGRGSVLPPPSVLLAALHYSPATQGHQDLQPRRKRQSSKLAYREGKKKKVEEMHWNSIVRLLRKLNFRHEVKRALFIVNRMKNPSLQK